jgi:hypothetical protein
MAHGRKRCFIGGVLLGGTSAVAGLVILALSVGIKPGPPGYPYFTEPSARKATLEWARLSPFPTEVEGFTITTGGTMFTRSFRVTFFGNPPDISKWVQSCPGIVDPKTEKTMAEDGTITYEMRGGGGAVYAELIHHPDRGTVIIRTYWS